MQNTKMQKMENWKILSNYEKMEEIQEKKTEKLTKRQLS
jgi:hypothetical protein